MVDNDSQIGWQDISGLIIVRKDCQTKVATIHIMLDAVTSEAADWRPQVGSY